MNKKNKILVGCLALLLALSAGYALFSDTITINGTATAKGNFDITATCQTGISSKLGTVESLGLQAEGGYENDTCSVVDDTVSLETDFLYPGARRYFTVKFTNNGSIDAILKDQNFTETEELCVADNMNGENKECKSQSNANSFVNIKGYSANLIYNAIAIEDPNGNILTESEMTEFVDETNLSAILKPGYSFYYCSTLIFAHSIETTCEGNEFFAEYNATLTYLFEQATN